MKKALMGFVCLLLFSCQKEKKGPADAEPALILLNTSYGNDPLQRMDIYLPTGRNQETTKLLVLIHGGGWMEGDKSDFSSYVSVLQQRLPDYAVVNLNYRLAPSAIFPAQENDIKAALEFIYAKKQDYKISDKYALLGASAGAHLALLQGYKYNTPVRPKAIISFFGPTELTQLYNSNFAAALILSQVTGTTPVANASVYQQSSPADFVNPQSPPTLLLHGGIDPLVPASQAVYLQNLLNAAAVPNQYVLYPTEGHGWEGASLIDSFDKIGAFLATYMN